jgi:hypothetical protein
MDRRNWLWQALAAVPLALVGGLAFAGTQKNRECSCPDCCPPGKPCNCAEACACDECCCCGKQQA